MAEYIEREAAVAFAQHAYNEWNLAMAAADGQREINLVYKRQELCKAVKSVFVAMPSADVAPVVHGHWFFAEYEFFTCSACGESYYNGAESIAQAQFYLASGHVHKYCPNCGAKMDGAERSTD